MSKASPKRTRRAQGDRATGQPSGNATQTQAKEQQSAATRGTLEPQLQGDAWERFWLRPARYGTLVWLRIAVGCTLLLFFASYVSDIGIWFSKDGLLPTDRLGRLVASTGVADFARWQFSPLYWIESPLLLSAFLATAIVGSIALIVGRGGRVLVVFVWLCFLALANRQWVLVGLEELPLSLGCLSLVFAGTGERRFPTDFDWRYGIAQRLAQVHGLAIVLTISLAQMQNAGWRTGEGVWRLLGAGAGRMVQLNLLSPESVVGAGVGWLLMLAPWAGAVMVAMKKLRRTGATVLIVHALVMAAMADQWLCGFAIAALLSALVPERND